MKYFQDGGKERGRHREEQKTVKLLSESNRAMLIPTSSQKLLAQRIQIVVVKYHIARKLFFLLAVHAVLALRKRSTHLFCLLFFIELLLLLSNVFGLFDGFLEWKR